MYVCIYIYIYIVWGFDHDFTNYRFRYVYVARVQCKLISQHLRITCLWVRCVNMFLCARPSGNIQVRAHRPPRRTLMSQALTDFLRTCPGETAVESILDVVCFGVSVFFLHRSAL